MVRNRKWECFLSFRLGKDNKELAVKQENSLWSISTWGQLESAFREEAGAWIIVFECSCPAMTLRNWELDWAEIQLLPPNQSSIVFKTWVPPAFRIWRNTNPSFGRTGELRSSSQVRKSHQLHDEIKPTAATSIINTKRTHKCISYFVQHSVNLRAWLSYQCTKQLPGAVYNLWDVHCL